VAQGRLKLVLEDYEPPPRPVSVIYPNARLLPARTRAFIDWMKSEFNGMRM
jgi:DNA-binding transcriptional LysR family regulator